MIYTSLLKKLLILIVKGFDTGFHYLLDILLHVLSLEMEAYWGMNPVGLMQTLWTTFECESRIGEVLQQHSSWSIGRWLELDFFISA